MAITRLNPNTIYLGGLRTQIGDLAAKEVITPGMLIERDITAGVLRWKKHATAGGAASPTFACDHPMANKGVDDTYAIGDLVEASVGSPGCVFWGLIASGQALSAGNKLESAGDGTLRVLAAGVAVAVCAESKTNNGSGGSGSLVRIRVETI